MAKKRDDQQNNHSIAFFIPHKFNIKDILQVIIGASILAIPVGFTEETWKLGEQMPVLNIIGFIFISLLFIFTFVYYNYHHRGNMKASWTELSKRVASTYVLSFIVVAVLLTLIQKAPWGMDWFLAFKRTALVTFPASMSAAVADTIK